MDCDIRLWIVDPFLQVLRFVRFEEVLAAAVQPFGGLVTLAPPGQQLPELGALRIRLDHDDWQEVIEGRMREADHIVMTAGFTSGLKWEFQQVQIQAALNCPL